MRVLGVLRTKSSSTLLPLGEGVKNILRTFPPKTLTQPSPRGEGFKNFFPLA